MSWIGLLLLTVTEVSTTCAVVISRVKVSCIASVDGIILWLLIWLVNYVAMLLVVCQLSRDVIGYEDSQSVIGAFIFLTVKNHHKQQENNSWHLATPPLVSPLNDVRETSAEIPPILMTRHYPDPGCSSDWMNFQPIRSTAQIWVVTRHRFLRCHFAGKSGMALRNVGCFPG